MSHAKTTTKAASSSRGDVGLAEGRRRSHRVMVRISLVVHRTVDGKVQSTPAYTESVNVHGAMICAAINPAADAKFEIEHKMSRERKIVRVTRAPKSSAEGFLIPVEFETPSADFWHISFPPTDWKPLE